MSWEGLKVNKIAYIFDICNIIMQKQDDKGCLPYREIIDGIFPLPYPNCAAFRHHSPSEMSINSSVQTSLHQPRMSLLFVSHTAVGIPWRTARSPSPSDTQTGSLQTATAATESKWRSRSTWRRSLGKGIDRELGTKDVGWRTCSISPSYSEKQNIKNLCVPPQMKSF